VCALTVHGAQAEHLTRSAEDFVKVPDGLDDAQVVALILNYVTAYQMIHRCVVPKRGMTALVTGANGGVGSALVELLALAGVEVVASKRGTLPDETVRLRYPDNTFAPREYNNAQALTATYLTTGVVFWGLVLTGLIDALLHARTVTEVHELREPPKELDKEPPRPRAVLQPLPAPLSGSPAGPALTGEDTTRGLPPAASPSYGLQLGATF